MLDPDFFIFDHLDDPVGVEHLNIHPILFEGNFRKGMNGKQVIKSQRIVHLDILDDQIQKIVISQPDQESLEIGGILFTDMHQMVGIVAFFLKMPAFAVLVAILAVGSKTEGRAFPTSKQILPENQVIIGKKRVHRR